MYSVLTIHELYNDGILYIDCTQCVQSMYSKPSLYSSCRSVLQHVVVCCSVLWCPAVCCSVVQQCTVNNHYRARVVVCCSVL